MGSRAQAGLEGARRRSRRALVGTLATALALALLPGALGDAGRAQTPEGTGSVVTVVGGSSAVPDGVVAGFTACTTTTTRVAGPDRWTTAALLAGRAADGAPVWLASGRDFPDALAAGPVVAAAGGVLLLTDTDELPAATAGVLRDRRPDVVTVLGGPAAVGEDVVAEVEALGATVRRVRGPDRYATAAALTEGHPAGTRLLVVSGATFADALAAGPVAVRTGSALLLVPPTSVPEIVVDALRRLEPSSVTVLGGATAISHDVVDRLREVVGPDVPFGRLAGSDRADTAAALADAHPSSAARAWVTTGRDFADALAAAPAVAVDDAVLLLTDDDLPTTTARAALAATGSDCRSVEVGVAPDEAATLGPSSTGGTTLNGTVEQQQVHLDRADDLGAVLLPPGTSAEVSFTYPKPVGDVPAVSWTQAVGAAATSVQARQPWRGTRPPAEGGITLAWQYTGDSERYRTEVDAAPGLTVTAPFRYYLGRDGQLVGGADPAFIADMHARGVDVWPTIHTCGAECIAAALSDPARRADLARRIAADAVATGADGINIDIEGFHVAERDAVTDFTEQLSALVQPQGLVTSFDLTVMTDTWHTPPAGYDFWSTGPDRRAISAAVDYAVLMAYDEFNRFRPRGPVASRDWVEEALRYQLRYSDADRILLGVPLYGRVWRGGDPTAVGIGTTEAFTAEGTRTPDPGAGVDRVDLPDGRVTWAETVPNLAYRVDLVDVHGLAGTASWRLGFDVPSVWPVLTDR